MVQPGDRVQYDGAEWVVVDVTGDGAAILRKPDDETGENLVAVEAGDL
jgi:hypothetical protein